MVPHDAWVRHKESETTGRRRGGEAAQGVGVGAISSYGWVALAEHGGVCLFGLDADADAREDANERKACEYAAGIDTRREACTSGVAWIGEELLCPWTTMCT